MADELSEALVAVVQRLRTLAAADPGLRAQLRRLGVALLDLGAEVTYPETDTEKPLSPLQAVQPSASPAEVKSTPEVYSPVRPAMPAPMVEAAPRNGFRRVASELDLDAVQTRCRLKAEACRWAARRRQLEQQGADFRRDIDPIDQQMILRARALPECFLWMCSPDAITPPDLSLYELGARCFETVARCVELTRNVLTDLELYRDEFEDILEMLAEAQSALRVAVQRLEHGSDPDQTLVFSWLRQLTDENRVFIARYMRVDDPANPLQIAQVAERASNFAQRLEEVKQRSRLRKKLFGKLKHKASLLLSDANGEHADEWPILINTVEQLVQDGVPPSNVQIREQLLPLLDNLPENLESSAGFQLVLREIDRYLANRPRELEPVLLEGPCPEVRAVAELLHGQAVVLIGGDCRVAAKEALEHDFQLGELFWVETREHESILGFEPYVARPEVAVVLLAIRWSSHSFSDVKRFCDAHDKPLVRLPAGYNPRQVARQVLAQCSERLRQKV